MVLAHSTGILIERDVVRDRPGTKLVGESLAKIMHQAIAWPTSVY
jgi:hypothetical protein